MCLTLSFEQRPTHDAHEGFSLEGLSTLHFQLNLSRMKSLVTGFAECDQVVRCITARLATFKMVNIEDLVLGSTVTVLANMAISPKNILTHVPKAELITLLIAFSFNIRILNLLNVKGRCLNHNLGDRQKLANRINTRLMRLSAVLYAWRKPALALRSLAVIEARRTVTRLAMTTTTTKSRTVGQKPGSILAKFNFRRVHFSFFRCCGKTDMFRSCVHT